LQETDLVRKCQQGEKKAQEALFDAYADGLFRLCFRYIKSQADSEDIMITALTKAYAGIAGFTYTGEGSLRAWLKKITVNESLMWLRRRHTFHLTESLDDSTPDPGLEQVSDLEADDIYKLITQLPIGYRTVFNLSVVEGYSYQEIGIALGISESTSRTQLFKAKAHLKKMLTQEGFHYGT
jgi:RNA polymerase sigma-70 factor (ECF subfamily)